MNAVRRTPWVTLLLLVLNLGMAYAVFLNPLLLDRWGYRLSEPHVADLFASLFLHVNTVHLLGNLVFVAAVGPSVEQALGPVRFGALYLASGVFGTLAYQLLGSGSGYVVGASGCVAGCVAYGSVRYSRTRVPLAPRLALPLGAVAVLWLSLQVVGLFVQIGETRVPVAYAAHLGGFLVGLLASLLFRAPQAESRQRGHETMDKMAEQSPAALLAAAEEHLRAHPDDARALRHKAEAERLLGLPEEEALTLLRLVDVVPDEEGREPLHRLIELSALERLPSVRRARLAAIWQEREPDLARALLESLVRDEREPQRPEALLALATLLRTRDPRESERLLEVLRRDHPLHPAVELARARGLPV